MVPVSNPELAMQWHPTKNKSLTPKAITCGSNRQVWWICKNGHEFKSRVPDRLKSKGCPFCSGRYVTEKNSVEYLYPSLLKEWDAKKNKGISPKSVSKGSHKKIWWNCCYGHSYQASIQDRTRNKPTGCPVCAGKIVSKEKSLENLMPILAKQWHPLKNNGLNPSDVSIGSSRLVWWVCPNGHEFQKIIKARTKCKNPLICPVCKKT